MTNMSPYAEMLGLRRTPSDSGEPILTLPSHIGLEGRPGFIHGGVIAGLLEMACYDALASEFGLTGRPQVKPINVSVDFLRGGLMVDTCAVAQIVRIGKRVANASAIAWQEDRAKPIATARMHLLLDR